MYNKKKVYRMELARAMNLYRMIAKDVAPPALEEILLNGFWKKWFTKLVWIGLFLTDSKEECT